MQQKNMEFNSEIKKILVKNNIKIDDGLLVLVGIYFDIGYNSFNQDVFKKLSTLGIFSKDYVSNSIVWNIPLFEEQETGFEWIGEWMDLFKQINPERRGTKADVLRRMRRFFALNPSVRKEDVFNATKRYLSGISDPTYCKKSHKFIAEQDGSSMLKEFIETTQKENLTTYNDMI